MKSSYDILGNHIRLVDYRNRDLVSDKVLGINIDKYFMPSVANVIGTDLSKYKLISKGLFACNPMHVGRDERLPVALYTDDTPAIVSPAYFMFEVIDNTKLNEEFLMMWFRRPEFDRICWLKTDGSVRGGITWNDICRIELPVPPLDEQLRIVSSYKAITDRITLKQRINDNLTEQMVIINKMMFPQTQAESLTINDVCTKIYSGGTPSTTEEAYWNGEYPWFSSGETSNDYVVKTVKTITKAGAQNSSTKLAKPYSTVIASAGVGLTRGQTSLLLMDTYVNQSVIVLEPKDEYAFFLYSNLKGRYDEIRNLSDLDSIRGSLTTKTVAQMPIPYITKESISDFNKLCSAFITLIKQNLREINKLENMSNNILTLLASR
ncbi:MAG TPA: restriction endonuclease subunit S [Ruminococcus sp.]|nr:restriction endonuclease subunit S [Ruminococcus sp.]